MNWEGCKNILCIRPDNMGDLIMSGPAIRALKETFNAKITVLTSSMARGVISHMPEIDDAIIFDLPWVKINETPDTAGFYKVIDTIKQRDFDAAVIFTVYSQNPLPTAMLVYLAGIPRVLAYCRENPYHLITNWIPDKEPYDFIKHQVRRDLDLVASVGAFTKNEHLYLSSDENVWAQITDKLTALGVDTNKPWLIMHAGVSERKRQYPAKYWVKAAKELIAEGYQILFTGSNAEKQLTDELQLQTGAGSFACGGLFSLYKFIGLVKKAPVVVSVNTGTVHIATAVGTPVVVLYAQTNPQHTPWNVPNKVLPFAVPAPLRSKNEVINHVNKTHYNSPVHIPQPEEIVSAVKSLVNQPVKPVQRFLEIPSENQATAAS
ncbi:glycosyltransferase family 9 protein [Mucilaginibacter limnophilus]|uniref:Glycosyltransferase family 9 protein n=1 Tax=Mucilaginibacter limnophilus TaxID=1932778 RepID=A0A3S2V5Y9_9SPHI|nr:glycosyltransferase family 9 protein [Mucilaginibacter limnophilus]RVT97292.1 glycosyltransferase family 9 protein [Mucilaginibacter limnophilus]